MNFGQLKARLRTSVKNADLNDLPDADAGSYINSGYLDLAARYPFHQTRRRSSFSTVAGTHKYNLPCDLTVLRRVMDTANGRKLKKVGDRFLASYRRGDYATTRPLHYTRYRNYIEIYPTPSDIYEIEIWYDAVPCLMEADEDCAIVPVTWHDGIWMRARWYYFMDRGDVAQQTQAQNSYALWLSDKPSEIEEETVDIDSGVELPTLTGSRGYSPSYRYDDGGFDFRDGR